MRGTLAKLAKGAKPRERPPREDGGQLMLLAGVVLTIAFILTALTLSQVSALEREAAADTSSPLIGEWRFLHERLATNLATAVGPETTEPMFLQTVLPTVIATFRAVEAEKGLDLVLRPAAGAAYANTGNEEALVLAGDWEDDGDANGVLWDEDCAVEGALADGCIVGVYLFMRLSDGESSIQESVRFETNQE